VRVQGGIHAGEIEGKGAVFLARHNPRARLDFFDRRSPGWDERAGRYPVLRVALKP
jgi:hypothetical protein